MPETVCIPSTSSTGTDTSDELNLRGTTCAEPSFVFGVSGGAAFSGVEAAGKSKTVRFVLPHLNLAGNASDGGDPLFEQPGPSATSFGASAASVDPPPVTAGTSTPAYDSFREKDPSTPDTILEYHAISAMPAYRDMSLDELRMQDYQQSSMNPGASGQTLFAAPATSKTRPFWVPMVQHCSTRQIFEGGVPGAFEPIKDQQRPMRTFGSGSTSVRRSAGPGSLFNQNKPAKPKNLEEFTRKFLLGEELVNTRFHIFSARPLSPSGHITKPHVLCANNLLLAKSSKYFLDLLSFDIDRSDPSLIELTDDEDVPDHIRIHDYGYESDSDLDDCDNDEPIHETSEEFQPATTTHSMFLVNPEGVSFVVQTDGASTSSNRSTAQETPDDKTPENRSGTRTQSLGSRNILVKDGAFQTWYTLLNYLSTGEISFLPLSSAMPGRLHQRPTSPLTSLDQPRCSAKSMYHLACKVGLDDLRDQALLHIRSNLAEHNILKEISCTLASKHPQLLAMEVGVLYFHIASPSVVVNFPALLQRIANKELPHGADIIVDIHSRFLRSHHPFSLALDPPHTHPIPPFRSSAPHGPSDSVGLSAPRVAVLREPWNTVKNILFLVLFLFLGLT